jgi:hypothetical protein
VRVLLAVAAALQVALGAVQVGLLGDDPAHQDGLKDLAGVVPATAAAALMLWLDWVT